MKNARTRQALIAAGLGGLLGAHLFLLMPITVYVGNFEEFSAPLAQLLALLVGIWLLVALIPAFVGLLLTASGNRRFVVVLAGLVLLLWLQGNVLVWNYGVLDGRRIDWSVDAWRGWLDGASWLFVLIVAALAGPKLGKALVVGACLVTVMVGASCLIMVYQHSAEIDGHKSHAGEDALREFYRFSSSRNVLHIVADGVQADIFADILAAGSRGQRIVDAMDGFVVFRNNTGAFPYTHMAVPVILGGKIYENETTIDAFLDDAVGKNGPTILNAAAAAGYEVDAALSPGLEQLYARGAATNVYSLRSDLHASARDITLQDSSTVFDIGVFRMTPHFLKRYVYNDQRWLTQQWLSRSEYMGLLSFAHRKFLREMADRITADRNAPVYKIMHFMASHNPMATTEDCRYSGATLPTTRETVTSQTRCALLDIVALFDRMKELGIYDSTTIVLMADHGAWLEPRGVKPKKMADGSVLGMPPHVMGLSIPMFAVKPPNSQGPLRVSLAPSWIVDAAQTIASMAGIEGEFPGRNALELAQDEKRVRKFYYYRYQRSEWHSDYLQPIQEYTIDGPFVDSSSWQAGKKYESRSLKEEAN